MSQWPSRLHTLEGSLKSRRKSRTKARTFKVMRFEDDSPRIRPNTDSVFLPKDIEEQIAVVRGRSLGKPSHGLLQLEERLLRTHDVDPVLPTIQRYDHETLSIPPMSQARNLDLPTSSVSRAFGGRFEVESFEETPATIVDLRMPGLYECHKPALIRDPVMTATSVVNVAPQAEPRTQISPSAVSCGSEQIKHTENKRALTQEQQDVAASFERDIASMLGSNAATTIAPEDKQWEDTMHNVANAKPATSTPAAGIPTPPAAPKPNAHKVFDQMGLAMNYANSFDFGTVDMSARFDQFDNELTRLPNTPMPKSTPAPSQALTLDDFDLVADLAEISGAQSTTTCETVTAQPPAPTTQHPTNPEPATTPAT